MKKNIAILITKLNGGGAERCASNLSIELSKFFNVVLIVFDGRNITYPYKGELLDLQISSSDSYVAKILNEIKRILAVRKIKRKYKISCTISLLETPNLVNVLSRTEDKVVVSIRNCLSKTAMGSGRRKMIEYVSRKADLTVALSRYVEKDMIRSFSVPQKKVMTIYNHCDAQLLNNLAESKKSERMYKKKADTLLFVTMGRLTYQKGQWHLLRAFKEVIEEAPYCRLLIFGEGELEAKLKDLANELGIEKNVDFMGFVKSPHSIIKICDAFVFPSLFEGLGNVVLEALAMGLPIIASDCAAGPREILAPETDITPERCKFMSKEQYGILVPVCDGKHFNVEDELTLEEKELAKAMIELCKDRELRNHYSVLAKKRISDFDKEAVTSEWVRTIERLIE